MRGTAKNVSIPFIAGQWSLHGASESSHISSNCVSIPFIAGQWSLLLLRNPARLPGVGFNPLHCGAVVASRRSPLTTTISRSVSIPFIAGQWSLPWRRAAEAEELDVSIPFIAGQWSLRRDR